MSITRQWGKHLVGPYELFSRDARIVTLFSEIFSNTEIPGLKLNSVPCTAEDIFGALMILKQESKEPVKMLINSNGGSVIAGFNIIHAMEDLQKNDIEVWTIVQGGSYSMASVILAAGTKGKRFAFSKSIVHFHAGSTSVQGRTQDVESIFEFGKGLTEDLNDFLAEKTKLPEFYAKREGLPYTETDLKDPTKRKKLIEMFTSKERMLRAKEALEAGVIDHILEPGDPITGLIFQINQEKRDEK